MSEYKTVTQVAEILQVHEETVRRWIRKNKLKAIKPGQGYRISEQDLKDFLETKRV